MGRDTAGSEAVGRPRTVAAWGGRVLALVAVAVGVAATVLRPLAADVGPLPADSTWFDADTLARVEAYWAPLRGVQVVTALVAAAVPFALAMAWRAEGRGRPLETRLARWPTWAQVAVVAVGVVAVREVVLLVPRWWVGVVHAGDYGLRTQSWVGWLADRGLATLVALVSTALVAVVVALLVRSAPRAWPLLCAAAVAVVSGLAVVVWPVLVEPLFVDVTDLPDGPVRRAVETTTAAAGWDDVPIVVADASRRTTTVNAHVSGLGPTRRVVLDDTLVELPPAQVAAVVGHELAHHVNRDIQRGWLGVVGALGGVGVLADVWWRRRLDRAAARGVGPAAAARALIGRPSTVAIVVAVALVAQTVTLPVASWASRRVEASADATGLELVDDTRAVAALHVSLVQRNLSDPSPPRWWLAWRASHPPAAERLHRADLAAR